MANYRPPPDPKIVEEGQRWRLKTDHSRLGTICRVDRGLKILVKLDEGSIWSYIPKHFVAKWEPEPAPTTPPPKPADLTPYAVGAAGSALKGVMLGELEKASQTIQAYQEATGTDYPGSLRPHQKIPDLIEAARFFRREFFNVIDDPYQTAQEWALRADELALALRPLVKLKKEADKHGVKRGQKVKIEIPYEALEEAERVLFCLDNSKEEE